MIKLLEGTRVVECAVLFNGGQTGRHLADLGADVIKVEAPGVSDYMRDIQGLIVPHHSPAHLFVNRNKRSVTISLRSDEGREVFFRLLQTRSSRDSRSTSRSLRPSSASTLTQIDDASRGKPCTSNLTSNLAIAALIATCDAGAEWRRFVRT